jgi:hypothetical protein
VGTSIGLQLNNLEAGRYTLRMFNAAAQLVFVDNINHIGNTANIPIQLNKVYASGAYQLELIDAKGNSYKQTILIAE